MNKNGMRILSVGWLVVILSISLNLFFIDVSYNWNQIMLYGCMIGLIASSLNVVYWWLPSETIKTTKSNIKDEHNLDNMKRFGKI